jgi:general secretion pathway protein C
MLTPTPATWTVRGATFALWALAAASVVYWGLKLGGSGSSVAARVAPPRQVAAVDPAAIARLLGSSPLAAAAPAAMPSLASRLQLVGVVAGVSSGGGAAVISVDGKPARPYRVGTPIEEGLVLQSVQGRRAVLAAQADGPALLTLELPPLRR